MKPLQITDLDEAARQELEKLYRKTKEARMRTRAQMILLSSQGLLASAISEIVFTSERTVQRWINRYQAEGVDGLYDAPRAGARSKVTVDYQELLLQAVRRRPRGLGLPFSLWTLQRLADYMAEQTGIRITPEAVRLHLKKQEIVLSRPQHKISSPDPDYEVKKRRSNTSGMN